MPALGMAQSHGTGRWAEWWPIAGGLTVLYAPVFSKLATGDWTNDEYAHGPLILAIVVWLAWRQRTALLAPTRDPSLVAGWSALVCGMLLYACGRALDISILELGSLLPVLAGTLLVMRGWSALSSFWFPILFLAFLIPLPGVLVDALTGPLKQQVSSVAEALLYAAGYPVARNGVVLTAGPYQLLVADACSGLNSMFSLTALGLLYLYLAERKNALHAALILASTVPIAFAANILRVVTLVLVTFHFGDRAGQSFIHGAAGIFLVLVGFALILGLDALLGRLLKRPAAA